MEIVYLNILSQVKQDSKGCESSKALTNTQWVSIDELGAKKSKYLFKPNGELFIMKNDETEKAQWEYIVSNSILITKNSKSWLLKHVFSDENVLLLKSELNSGYTVFINEDKYAQNLNSIGNIAKYLSEQQIKQVEKQNFQAIYAIWITIIASIVFLIVLMLAR